MGTITNSGDFASSNILFEGLTSSLTAYVGVIVLTAILPFAAGLILDGIIHVFRGRGLKPLMIAVGLTIAIAAMGALAISWGQPGTGPSPQTIAGMTSISRFLLPFSVGLSLLAFVVRMASLALRGGPAKAARA